MISYEPLFQTMKRKNISTYEREKEIFAFNLLRHEER